MTLKTRGAQSASYAYRFRHYLTEVSSNFPGESGVSYLTGGDGKRRSATVASVETNYRWDAGYTVLNEEDDSGDLERTFVGRNTAQIEGDDAATGDYFYHTHDHLGSTRNVYAQNKDDAAAFEYTPYGRELFATNRALTTRGYTGHAREAAMGGAYYAPFRYYLPNLARWEKRDPLGMVDGPNVYAYVRGEPIMHLDTQGLFLSGAGEFLYGPIVKDPHKGSTTIRCKEIARTTDCVAYSCTRRRASVDYGEYRKCMADCTEYSEEHNVEVVALYTCVSVAWPLFGFAWGATTVGCYYECLPILQNQVTWNQRKTCCRTGLFGAMRCSWQ